MTADQAAEGMHQGECLVWSRGRRYLVCRFRDGLVAVYDDQGRLAAGWPVTAEWPPLALDGSDAEAWSRLIQRLKRGHGGH